MEAKLTVNGFGFVARYGEKDVERVLLPLLWRWTELQKESGSGAAEVNIVDSI